MFNHNFCQQTMEPLLRSLGLTPWSRGSLVDKSCMLNIHDLMFQSYSSTENQDCTEDEGEEDSIYTNQKEEKINEDKINEENH